MTRSPWQQPLEPVRADVAVVGAGIVGAATAWALAEEAPERSVVLVEAERPAWGASGRNAGFLLLGTHTDYASAVDALGRDAARRLWAFTQENLDLAVRLADGADVGFSLSGSVIAAGDAAEAERLARAHALLSEDGVASDLLTPDGLRDRIGAVGFPAGLFVPQGGTVDPARLVARAIEASGARLLTGARVVQVAAAGEGVRLDLAGGGSVEAGQAVLCVNAFLPDLVPDLAWMVRPVRAQMFATAPAAPILSAPVYSHDGFYYVRQRPDGRVLVGGARHRHVGAEVGTEDATTPALQADLEAYLTAHVPGTADARVERRWSGTMGFSPDGRPLLGDVPGVPGAYVATGFTGHGMGYGLRFGRLIARTLFGRDDSAAPLFSAQRLHESDPRDRA